MDERQRSALRFRVLGPVQAEAGGKPLRLGPLKQRLVLAVLLSQPNRPVSLDVLTETVWHGEPPRTARKNLHVYVSALRRVLTADAPGAPATGGRKGGGEEGDDAVGDMETGPVRLMHEHGGYLLRVERTELDALIFEDLTRQGREAAAAGELDAAAALLRQALDLWRGRAFADLHDVPLLRAQAERLEEHFLSGYEDWSEAELERGGASTVAATIGELVERHPLRERLQAARMKAFYLLGRQAEGLAGYDRYRQLLARELGLTPSPALEAQYHALLAGGPGRPSAGPARTVLPADAADFTGRSRQVSELTETLGPGGRVALLVGPTGIGKTALAVRIAHLLRGRFPDGRILVAPRTAGGAPRSWQATLAELARLVRLSDQPGDDPARTLVRWHAWLAGRKVLLILDDVPDETVARVLLPVEGESATLLTSRAQLAGLAPVRRVELPPYTMSEALELLGRIIGRRRLHGDLDAAREIVTAGGMLPLAVRASGLKLAVLRHLPLREYASRLADEEAVLDELAAGDIAVRPRLAHGWRDLSPSGRAALLRLGRLAPGRPFTLARAAVALGRDEAAALRELEALIGAGAVTSPAGEVTVDHAVYALPRLIHLYAREGTAYRLDQGRTTA
ncbi:BTAD domain-containing putative transcriptional regulator [Streptomyces sp. NPDC101213]|uniref:AfsR/SARP family transcriptional regulator n=1 Tax=Streptomyces sp. NPDC101213 TaxID=3366130 RepID=UPI003822252F